MNEHDSRRGVSYFDVAAAAWEIGRTHYGRIHYGVFLPVRRVNGVAFDIHCLFRGGIGSLGGSGMERGISGRYPTVWRGSFAGELLRLAYEIDAKLTEEARSKGRLI